MTIPENNPNSSSLNFNTPTGKRPPLQLLLPNRAGV